MVETTTRRKTIDKHTQKQKRAKTTKQRFTTVNRIYDREKSISLLKPVNERIFSLTLCCQFDFGQPNFKIVNGHV